MAMDESDGLQKVFDIAMAPVVALNLRDGCDVAGTESRCWGGKQHQPHQANQQYSRRVLHRDSLFWVLEVTLVK